MAADSRGGPTETGGGGGAGGGGGDDGPWSEPLTLQEAVGKAPVLVQLEDGSRGAVESLSFSLGDVMALEGQIQVKGRTLVLAHYTTEVEKEEGGGAANDNADKKKEEEESLYRSLLSIPWEHLPEVDVRVRLDPGGRVYSNFVSAHFPHCNWRGQQRQLLDSLDDDYYDSIQEIAPVLPKPSQMTSSSEPQGGGPPGSGPPPPRPPRSPAVSPHARGPPPDDFMARRPPQPAPRPCPTAAAVGKTARVPQQADDEQRTPPPRPPRLDKVGPPPRAENGRKDSESSTAPAKSTESSNPSRSYVNVCKTEALFPSEAQEDQEVQDDSDGDNYLELVEDSGDEECYIAVEELKKAAAKSKQLKKEREKQERKKTYSSDKTEKKENASSTQKPEKEKTKRKDSDPGSVKPMLRVQPLASAPASSPSRPAMQPPVTSLSGQRPDDDDNDDDDDEECYEIPIASGPALLKMTCRQLCARLRECGMQDLAKTCESNSLDGAFLCSVSDQDLRKAPFGLSDFDVNLKLPKVKGGWVPK